MALADVVIETRTIEVGNTSFTVRGLCFADITALLMAFKDEINELVERFVQAGEEAETEADMLNPAALLARSPALMALWVRG